MLITTDPPLHAELLQNTGRLRLSREDLQEWCVAQKTRSNQNKDRPTAPADTDTSYLRMKSADELLEAYERERPQIDESD